MNNLILATAVRNGLSLQQNNQTQDLQSAFYEKQNINFAKFILKLSKKGGNR